MGEYLGTGNFQSTVCKLVQGRISLCRYQMFDTSVPCCYFCSGKHSDNERQIKPKSPIISVSFGATRTFRVRCSTTGKIVQDIPLRNDTVLIMGGAMQRTHQHEVPKIGMFLCSHCNWTLFFLFSQVESGACKSVEGLTSPCDSSPRNDKKMQPHSDHCQLCPALPNRNAAGFRDIVDAQCVCGDKPLIFLEYKSSFDTLPSALLDGSRLTGCSSDTIVAALCT